MVKAWYLDGSDGDQREEHQRDPPQHLDMTDVFQLTGVLYFKLNPHSYREELDMMKTARGYTFEDELEISSSSTPNFEEQKILMFREHLHAEEEVRFAVAGSGYFDILEGRTDSWIRVRFEAGDLLIIPAYTYHRFTLDFMDYIKTRSFSFRPSDESWTFHRRPPCAEVAWMTDQD